MTTSLALFGNKVLRSAIARNLVSFPAQVPIFAKQQAGDAQARIVQLYFVAGWTIRKIAKRYNLTAETVRKSLTEWRVRAISSGYIQEIGPEVLPTLASSAEALEDTSPEDLDREVVEQAGTTQQVRTPLQVVRIPLPQPAAERIGIVQMLLEEIEVESDTSATKVSRWQPFRLRLLRILKQECRQASLNLSTLQIERIEDVAELYPNRAFDLLRDLRNRIADEEQCAAGVHRQEIGRARLLHLLLEEMETTVQEAVINDVDWPGESGWTRRCIRFLTALKQEFMELGMEFSVAQVKRVENALSSDRERLGDLLRDLRNRLADEQEHTSLASIATSYPRRLAAGSSR